MASKRFTTAVVALVVALSLLALALGMMRPAEAQLWCPGVGVYDQRKGKPKEYGIIIEIMSDCWHPQTDRL